MLAIEIPRFGNEDVLRLAEIPVPEAGPGHVSIDVTYAGVNFTDVLHRRGAIQVRLPFVPGIEVTGHIRAIGPGVTGLTVGEPVAALTVLEGGGYADVVVVDARMVARLAGEGGDSPLFAATPSNTATAYLVVDHVARVSGGESVLVHSAAGGVGNQVGQVARLAGAGRVIGTVSTPDKIEPARALGFDEVVTREEMASAAHRFAPSGFDVIVDPVGGGTRNESLDHLDVGGRLVALGNSSGGEDVGVSTTRLWIEGKAVAGHSTVALAQRAPETVADALARAVQGVSNGDITVPVSEVVRLDQAGEAHKRLESGRNIGKLVLAIHG